MLLHLLAVTMVFLLCLQTGTVPLPGMSAQSQQILDRMGLSFSCSIELFLRLVRHWRQILQHHGCRPARDEMPIVDLPEEITSKVSCLST